MINNKFSTLLGEKLLKITTIASDTGISRTTLTNLYYRRSTAISFDVLDKLCSYLECEITDIIEHKLAKPQKGGGNQCRVKKMGSETTCLGLMPNTPTRRC